MRKLILTISILTISFGLSAQTVVSGNITGVWEADGNPYIVVGNINIVNLLVIEPGVVVQFQAGGWRIEAGEGDVFVARGTEEEPIIFEPYQGNTPGLWDKIYFNDSEDDDTIRYCKISGANIGVYTHTSKTVIYGCDISNCVTGIYVTNYGYNSYGTATIINCTFFGNSTGLNVNGYYGPLATVTNSIFSFNNIYGIRNSSVGPFAAQDIIYSCFWENTENFSGISFPSGFGSNGNYLNFNGDSCDVYYNIYYDPYFVDTTNANFNLQPISKCIDAGTNLILGQFTYDPDGTMPDMGANYYPHSNAAILAYSFPQQAGPAEIDDVNQDIVIEVVNGTNVTNLIAEFNLSGGASATVNGVPQESGVTPNDFTFPVTYEVTSDGGTNVQYWLVTVNIATGINESVVHTVNIYPNPFSNRTTINFPNPTHSNYKLSIFNISGNKVFEMYNIKSDKIEFKRGNLPNGVYLIEVKGEKIFWGKMVVK
ncbi:MAG: T9SS type A sorting domain-containing protein [Bacteroidales bacterium]|nr:T9SS type A sorting domain-containing protein [Bacteroidales bacterium]